MCILPFVGAVSMSRMSFQAMGKPQYAFAITLVRQFFLYIPLLLLLNRLFGFGGMIWAQPVTEMIMMTVSVSLLIAVIRREDRAGRKSPDSLREKRCFTVCAVDRMHTVIWMHIVIRMHTISNNKKAASS
jgi:hypothetical protein